MSQRLDKVTNVVLIATCCLLSGLVIERLLADRAASEISRPVSDIESEHLAVDFDDGRAEGKQNARLVLIEFGDYQCPFCGTFNRETYPDLERDFVKSGTVRHVFKHLPLSGHPLALDAARAAECARDQGRFEDMHRQLFLNPSELGIDYLPKHAVSIGLDKASFVKCLSNADVIDTIKVDQAEALRLGVASTPTFFVGRVDRPGHAILLRRIKGAQPYSVFKSQLDDLKSTSAQISWWPKELPKRRAATIATPDALARECTASSCPL